MIHHTHVGLSAAFVHPTNATFCGLISGAIDIRCAHRQPVLRDFVLMVHDVVDILVPEAWRRRSVRKRNTATYAQHVEIILHDQRATPMAWSQFAGFDKA